MIQNNTELMKRLRYLIAFTIAIIFSQANQLHAQTPQYQYTINPLPQEVLCDPAFGWRIMAKKQTIYTRYKFPTMPAGQLKAIYFRVGQDYQLIHDPGAACTVTDFSAAIGYTNDTVFRRIGNGPDSFKTGLTNIYGPDTFSFPCSGKKGDWIRIPVTKNGFYYNPEGAKFVVEYKIKKQNNENMWLPCIESSTFDLGARTTIRILSDIDSLTGSASLGYMDLGIDLVSAGVNDIGSNLSSFGLFPNPATEGRFSISMETKQAVRQLSISIRNAIGQTLYTSSYQNTGTRFFKEFDQSKLPSGVYFLELNVDAEKIVRQLVLQ